MPSRVWLTKEGVKGGIPESLRERRKCGKEKWTSSIKMSSDSTTDGMGVMGVRTPQLPL